MKLTAYIREMRRLDRELEHYRSFNSIAKDLLSENAQTSGSKYPTLDALWREAYRRAEALEKEKDGQAKAHVLR